ncbi:MarR family transcriptional regulator [Proteiniborus sp. DW1]|uniref:MarR family winged helix-turn-helix transcriptional regulator n=1 Tax=Proteiniborus sp. DW1 TaxID=1889883 RepID=UPI00092E06A0|nr:MarR family transcriptional regulator [Proteiniborus sp. DW1]SCG82537.1 MarR family transcriptional regulator [Proteiniborus sp. DW1]
MNKKIEINRNNIFLTFNWKSKKLYEKLFYPILKEFGLSQNEADVLLFLFNNKPLDTAKDIVEYRAISKSLISKSVDLLIKKGYLSSEVDKVDRRSVHLKIKPTAIPIVEKLHEIQKDYFTLLLRNVTDEEYDVFETVLSKIYRNITDELDKGNSFNTSNTYSAIIN